MQWGFRQRLRRDKQGANLVREDGSERPALSWLRDYVRAKEQTRAAMLESRMRK